MVSVVRNDGLLPVSLRMVPRQYRNAKQADRQGCRITSDLFLTPIDSIVNKTAHHNFVGASLGDEVFMDLDFAKNVAILPDMLEIIILSLDILSEEARPVGLEVTWYKTNQSMSRLQSPSIVEVHGRREGGRRQLHRARTTSSPCTGARGPAGGPSQVIMMYQLY